MRRSQQFKLSKLFRRSNKTDDSREISKEVKLLAAYIRYLRISGFELIHQTKKKNIEESCSYLFEAMRHNNSVSLTEAEQELITTLMKNADKVRVFN